MIPHGIPLVPVGVAENKGLQADTNLFVRLPFAILRAALDCSYSTGPCLHKIGSNHMGIRVVWLCCTLGVALQ